MPTYTGTALYLAFDGTEIDTDFREFSVSEEMGIVDGSAGADANRTYLTTLKDGTASGTFLDQTGGTAATALYNKCIPGAEGTLEWGPEGNSSDDPRHHVNAIVTTRDMTVNFEDVTEVVISWQYSGAVTDTAYA